VPYQSSKLSIRVDKSTLTLFVARICTDDANHTLATDDFAIAANFLD
jgi:hypothetical protein